MNRASFADLTDLGEGVTSEYKCSGTSGTALERCAFANVTGRTTMLALAACSTGSGPAETAGGARFGW